MKTLYFVALALAAPAMAQSTSTPDQTSPPTSQDGASSTTTTTGQAPMNGSTTNDTPTGGYQPASQPMVTPGATVVFQPSRPVSEVYPAPAPLDSYPFCKKGQTDKCRQRGG